MLAALADRTSMDIIYLWFVHRILESIYKENNQIRLFRIASLKYYISLVVLIITFFSADRLCMMASVIFFILPPVCIGFAFEILFEKINKLSTNTNWLRATFITLNVRAYTG